MLSKYARRASRYELPILLTGALLVAFITCFVQPMAAQEYRGTIRGVVTDPTHAVVPNAKVTLRNVNTTIEKSVQTDSSGFYIFDLVQPGSYTVNVEGAGFQKFVQENVTVLTGGDVTVNAVLTLGALTQTVTVTEQVAQVQFNTSTLTTTITGSNLRDLPVLARNPFTLAMLNAGVINQYWDISHRLPFYMWSNGGMDMGGPTGGKNEQLLDGTPLNISARGSYNAPMDAVQEVVVQMNIPDAEYGFSAGGTLNLSIKSGTNAFHGSLYYMGRQPIMNAMANRITREKNVVKQNIYGATIGHPIIKNKLFNFFSYEKWNATQPSYKEMTMPTDAERTGDFSQALTSDGKPRIIYDPLTTVFNPVTNTATRTPFLNNIIPANRIDPTAAALMPYIWGPNTTPDSVDGLYNFKITYPWWTHYWNLNDRGDWNISDKWRMFLRFSKFQTRLDNVNWGHTIAVPSDNGGTMDALNASADVLWMMSPRTTLDIRMGATYDEDTYNSTWAKAPTSVWAGLWPNSNWYTNVLSPFQGIYFPRFAWCGIGCANEPYTGVGGWWLVQGRSWNPTINLTHEHGNHHLKFGWQLRYEYDQNANSSGPGETDFNAQDTESTFLTDAPALSGDQWASSLIGVVNGGSANVNPHVEIHQQQWTLYAQDDIHLSSRITLNLGLRWERETAPLEVDRHLVSTLDLTDAIPELQPDQGFKIWGPAQLAALPASALNLSNAVAYKFNGAMIYTNDSNPRMYKAPWDVFLPRAGIAYRLNDKTAIRLGYARFAVPWVTIHPETNNLPQNGYSQSTSILGPIQGVPRTVLSDPYPTTTGVGKAYNPVIVPAGNSRGVYQDLGNGVSFWNGNQLKTPMNDRYNFNVQRQLPNQFLAEATFFMMFEHNAQDPSMWGGDYTYNLNQMDPMLTYQYKGVVDQAVPNPFYNLLPANKMNGSLRTEPTVALSQLLKPYPQYGDLTQHGWPGQRDHYYGLALQFSRPMAHGWTFLGTYNYSRQTHTDYYNDIDNYNHKYTMFDRAYPRHNIRMGGTYELPFGIGRQHFSNVPRAVDAVIGGWATSHIFYWRSGDLVTFGSDQLVCDPSRDIPSGYYFNGSCLKTLPAYTIRTNPRYYEGVRGPKWWEIDSTLVKYFKLTERFQLEFRMEFYNLTNSFMPSDPDTTPESGTTGRSTWVAGGNYGREIQFSTRLHF